MKTRQWYQHGFGGRRWYKGAGFATGKRGSICFAVKAARRRSGAPWRSARAGRAAVHWLRSPATEKIAFDHKFEPIKKMPPESR
jgi:hypothetical protein